jgi:hypothetical protein
VTLHRAAFAILVIALSVTGASSVGAISASALSASALSASPLSPRAPSPTATGDPVDPIVTFEGPLTLTDGDGAAFPLTARLVVDCTVDPCTALVTLLAGDFVASPSNDQTLPLTAGAVSVGLPEYGSLCDERWIGAGQLDVVVTQATASISRTSAPAGPVFCSDGAEASATAIAVTGTVALVSGSVCVVDDSCVASIAPVAPKASRVVAGTGRTPSIAAIINVGGEPTVLASLAPIPRTLEASTIAWITAGGLVLSLLVGFPSVLLDSATERISGHLEGRRERRGLPPRQPWERPPLTLLGWPLAVLGLTVAAVASAFVDPDFSLDANGLRLTASVVISFVVTVTIGWVIVTILMLIAHPRSRPRVEFRPLTLLIVAGAVLLSRLTGFEPGIIFGLLAGIGFGTELARGPRGRASLIAVVYFVAIGAGAWWGYTVLTGRLDPDPSWFDLLVVETLSAVTITAVAALPVALVPVRGLLGESLWAWNRWVWAVTYLVASAAFLLVLLPLPDSWQAIPSSVTGWLIAYGAYATAALLIWLMVVRPWRRQPSPALERATA